VLAAARPLSAGRRREAKAPPNRGSVRKTKVGRARRSAPTSRRTALRGREKAKAAREAPTQIRLAPLRLAPDKVGRPGGIWNFRISEFQRFSFYPEYGGQTGGREKPFVEQAEQLVDDAGRQTAAAFPAGQGFLSAVEQCRELVLGQPEALAEVADVVAVQDAHVAGPGALDEFGGSGGDELLAEIFIDLDLDGVCQNRLLLRSRGQVDVERDLAGG